MEVLPILSIVKSIIIDAPEEKLAIAAARSMGKYIGYRTTGEIGKEFGVDFWEGVVNWKDVLPDVKLYFKCMFSIYIPKSFEENFLEGALEGYTQYGEETSKFWREENDTNS